MTTQTNGGDKEAAPHQKPRWAQIYGLRARTDEHYSYIGSTVDRKRRLYAYTSGKPTHNPSLTSWLDTIGRDALVMDVICEVPERERFEVERETIEDLKEAGAQLLNWCPESHAVKEVRQFLAAMAKAPKFDLTPLHLRCLPTIYLLRGHDLLLEHGSALRLTHPELIQELKRALRRSFHGPLRLPTTKEIEDAASSGIAGGWLFYGDPAFTGGAL